MEHSKLFILIFTTLSVLIILPQSCHGKEAEAMDDSDDKSLWTSSGKKAQDDGYCLAGDGKCKPKKKVLAGEGPTPPHVAASLHDKAANQIIDTIAKYAKDFTEGNLDWRSLIQTEYGQKISKAVLTGGLPGGNPAMGAAFKVFRTVSHFLQYIVF
ncbi:hypothetical protein RvY_13564-2 [Ramazzottius varieornatus]|uniref:Uncharacterized protein n=1 Tax=Ramazzottius varieornatus TaxID=947166 RepID=A0A1D1VSC4_RAMVA|nr:hypothetical protein RvY_13564-2 [Ramazzottius varieornatus]